MKIVREDERGVTRTLGSSVVTHDGGAQMATIEIVTVQKGSTRVSAIDLNKDELVGFIASLQEIKLGM